VQLAGLLIESWLPHSHYSSQVLCATIAIAIYGLRMLGFGSRAEYLLG